MKKIFRFIWKTYEGQLDLGSLGALKNVSPLAETFDFSVEPGMRGNPGQPEPFAH